MNTSTKVSLINTLHKAIKEIVPIALAKAETFKGKRMKLANGYYSKEFVQFSHEIEAMLFAWNAKFSNPLFKGELHVYLVQNCGYIDIKFRYLEDRNNDGRQSAEVAQTYTIADVSSHAPRILNKVFPVDVSNVRDDFTENEVEEARRAANECESKISEIKSKYWKFFK